MSLYFKGFLRHTTPHFMAYFGVIFFANMGGGGGQPYFHTLQKPHVTTVNYLSGKRAHNCNGRPLDRVTKSKHRPNRQKMSKNCPKIVFSVPTDNFWTFFVHFSTFFGHFVDIPFFWAVQRFARHKHITLKIHRDTGRVSLGHPVEQTGVYRPVSQALGSCASNGPSFRADFWEGDEDSNFSLFRVQRFTEWPGPLH